MKPLNWLLIIVTAGVLAVASSCGSNRKIDASLLPTASTQFSAIAADAKADTFTATADRYRLDAARSKFVARTNYEAQQTDEPVEPDRRDNLWSPLPGDHGVHGTFDDRSSDSSPQLWANMNRGWLALAGGAVAGLTIGILCARNG